MPHPYASQLPANPSVKEKPAVLTDVAVYAEHVKTLRSAKPGSVCNASLNAMASSAATMAAAALVASAGPVKSAKVEAASQTGHLHALPTLVRTVVSVPRMPQVFLNVPAQMTSSVTTARHRSLFKTAMST